jgi:2-polyprenyl-3-methyl-5-hydroxy-6-metoxy-1,4-benzoquinol methylase
MAYTEYNCNVCDSSDAADIKCLARYTSGEPIHVCKNCGFIYVKRRRSFDEIACAWSNEIFATAAKPSAAEIFTAARPAIRARLIHVLETVDQDIGLDDKALCDIGAGEGVFLDYAKRLKKPKELFGIEPSLTNCNILNALGIDCFNGTLESYLDSDRVRHAHFDIVTIQWTLECSTDCRNMLSTAWEILKPGGHIVIGTGSRILVPFRKPLQFYISKGPQDTHSFRFSPKSLNNLFRLTGFEPVFVNRYIDNDVLCMIGKKIEVPNSVDLEKDDYREIIEYFERWNRDSVAHFADWVDT